MNMYIYIYMYLYIYVYIYIYTHALVRTYVYASQLTEHNYTSIVIYVDSDSYIANRMCTYKPVHTHTHKLAPK